MTDLDNFREAFTRAGVEFEEGVELDWDQMPKPGGDVDVLRAAIQLPSRPGVVVLTVKPRDIEFHLTFVDGSLQKADADE
jgi:hypothetical protein